MAPYLVAWVVTTFVAWTGVNITVSIVRTPAWYSREFRQMYGGHPPEGCHFWVQNPRRAWLILPAHRTNDVLCFQVGRLQELPDAR